VGKENDMWILRAACMHPDAVFDTEHKMRPYFTLEDAIGKLFSLFLVRGPEML
jgi:hypothetical protein